MGLLLVKGARLLCHDDFPKMIEPSAHRSRKFHDAILVFIILAIVICGAAGGFFIGRKLTRDAFIERVNGQSSNESTTLLTAGIAPRNLYQIIGRGIDDPVTAQALAKIYNVPAGTRDALARRLNEVVWLPPYQPAPFVGHVARPFSGENLHINVLGFRDQRDYFENKDERTVRIFITGGSTAWGVGASSDGQTISALLEQELNAKMFPHTAYRYEVINTAFPAWSTTQEKILIQQRLIRLHPDVVLMFSGSNDVHWALHDRDINWFYSYMDQNYIALLNETYRFAGHSEWSARIPVRDRRPECSGVAETTQRNVEEAAYAAGQAKSRLLFVLQPNIVSTTKHLTQYEQRALQGQDKPYWNSCYQALRKALTQIKATNYQFLDLSRLFGMLDDSTELFIDAYHFADAGNNMIARELAEGIDWKAVTPIGSDPTSKDAQGQ